MSTFPLVSTPGEMVDGYLNDLFNPEGDMHDLGDLKQRAGAFKGLAEQFASAATKPYGPDDLTFDPHALKLMLGRFQRDAFGVGRLFRKFDERVRSGEITGEFAEKSKNEIYGIGLRLGTDKPRKTRVAAVFSLWMCVFRPVSLNFLCSKDDKSAWMFPAALNFWIARNYLLKFGTVLIGPQFKEHFNRALHDFTYRDINLSSLEMFYCGMFVPRHDSARPADALE